MRHIDIYHESGRYAGWPANCGIWSWEDEILVGFAEGAMSSREYQFHPIDYSQPQRSLFAHSLNGGESWEIVTPNIPLPAGRNFALTEASQDIQQERVDFTSPDFLMTVRMTRASGGGRSIIYLGKARDGSEWQPWAIVPVANAACRTDYIVLNSDVCLLFGSADKQNGREGRPFCCITEDGGLSWRFQSWICDEPVNGFVIMPSTILLENGTLLTALRKRHFQWMGQTMVGEQNEWILRACDDGRGLFWRSCDLYAATGIRSGNPPHLINLLNGQKCITYAYRGDFSSIAAIIFRDDRTWRGYTLRGGNESYDIGYCRSVQRTDGKIVTVYYWCDTPHSERHIAATIWEP